MVPEAMSRSPFAYHAFGLTIRSDVPLAELAPAETSLERRELLVRTGKVPAGWQAPDIDPFFQFTPDGDILRWNAVGAFHLTGNDTIVVQPAENADLRLISFPLLGPVLALYLHRSGRLVLHASAVDVEGRAFVVLGDKGAGKSTLAGALVSNGHRLLSDDLVVVTRDKDGGLFVEAAAGQLKLYPDSLNAVELPDHVTIDADLHPAVLKRQHRLAKPFEVRPASLGAVVTLGRDGQPHFQVLSPADALQTLIRFSYPIRFGDQGLGRERGQFFAQCADLSTRYPVGRLMAADGLDALGRTVAAIESYMRALQSSTESGV
jgi:hypothetical protein